MPRAISDSDLNQLIATDPQIQQIIAGVWGQTPVGQRPGDTPKNLEAANKRASQQIASVLQSRGVQLPKHTFINPRSSAVEHEHGWAGLPTAAKVAIIAGAAATGIGAAGALGAFGGAAGAAGGAGGAGAAGAGGAASGGLLASTPLLSAAPMVGSAAATGGSLAAGVGAAGAGGGSMGLGSSLLAALKNPRNIADLFSVVGKQQEGKAAGAATQAGVQQNQDRNAISLFQAKQAAENEAAQRDLERQKFGADEQGRNAKNAIYAALLGGDMPRTSINVPGIQSASVSGGLMDALKNNPDALASLSMLKGKANTALDKGPSFTGGNMVAPPSMTPLPEMGKGNGFLNAIANIGQIVGGMGSAFPTKKPTVTPPNSGDWGGYG